jgi:hypothetical protein
MSYKLTTASNKIFYFLFLRPKGYLILAGEKNALEIIPKIVKEIHIASDV